MRINEPQSGQMGKLKASTAGTGRYPKCLWLLRWLHRVQGVKIHDNFLVIQACIVHELDSALGRRCSSGYVWYKLFYWDVAI